MDPFTLEVFRAVRVAVQNFPTDSRELQRRLQPSSAAMEAGEIVFGAGDTDMLREFVIEGIQIGGPEWKTTEIYIVKPINLCSPGVSESAGGIAQERNESSR